MFSVAVLQLKYQIELNIRTGIMYFIVYIPEANQNVVVPYQWLKINRFLEWTINNGINSNITFDVFYTQNPDAFHDGVPRLDFAPIMQASSTSIFPNEGFYKCYIRRFRRKFYLHCV